MSTDTNHRTESERTPNRRPGSRERLLAAVAYLGPGFLVPALLHAHDPWVRWHTAQGFVLFFAEAAIVAAAIVVDQTIGRIPWIGLLVMVLIHIAMVVAFLVVSAIGMVKALAGERFELPILGKYVRHVPGASDVD